MCKYNAKQDDLDVGKYLRFKFYEVHEKWLWLFQDTTIPDPHYY